MSRADGPPDPCEGVSHRRGELLPTAEQEAFSSDKFLNLLNRTAPARIRLASPGLTTRRRPEVTTPAGGGRVEWGRPWPGTARHHCRPFKSPWNRAGTAARAAPAPVAASPAARPSRVVQPGWPWGATGPSSVARASGRGGPDPRIPAAGGRQGGRRGQAEGTPSPRRPTGGGGFGDGRRAGRAGPVDGRRERADAGGGGAAGSGVRSGEVGKAVGVLEVIPRPAAVVGGVNVPAWCEARVTGRRVN